MIIDEKTTEVDGLIICGQPFVPAEEGSSHAVFVRNGRICGVTYVLGNIHPYLRCSPGIILPSGARDEVAWQRAAWTEDERLYNIRIDEEDGEVIFYHNEPIVGEDPERCIQDALDFLLGDSFHCFVVDYVARCLGKSGESS